MHVLQARNSKKIRDLCVVGTFVIIVLLMMMLLLRCCCSCCYWC